MVVQDGCVVLCTKWPLLSTHQSKNIKCDFVLTIHTFLLHQKKFVTNNYFTKKFLFWFLEKMRDFFLLERLLSTDATNCLLTRKKTNLTNIIPKQFKYKNEKN